MSRLGSPSTASRTTFIAAAAAAVWIATPLAASAHLANTGMGPLYDGGYHFVTTPQVFLPIAAVGVFGGLRGARHARGLLLAALGWIAGGVIHAAGVDPGPLGADLLAAAAALLGGGLVAANANLGARLTLVFGFAISLAGSLESFAQVPPAEGYVSNLLGGAVAAFVVGALSSGLALGLAKGWRIHVFRAVGAWVCAFGLLMAGWSVQAANTGADAAPRAPRTGVATDSRLQH